MAETELAILSLWFCLQLLRLEEQEETRKQKRRERREGVRMEISTPDLRTNRTIDYDDSVDYLGKRDEHKLSEIVKVKVNNPIKDLVKFAGLINRCKKLEQLHLKNVALGQLFYDRLPGLCKDILTLDIELGRQGNQINCGFVKKFSRLESFSINQALSSKVVEELFYCENLRPSLNSIGFKHPENYIEICVLDEDECPESDDDLAPSCLRIGRHTAQFDDLIEVIRFLKDVLKI